jgi:hypothetical protein
VKVSSWLSKKAWIVLGIIVVLAGIGSTRGASTTSPSEGVPLNTRVFIKVVQQEYPTMSGAEAITLGATACDAFDAGGNRMSALRAVAREDGRTERARYITEAATTSMCPKYDDR